MNLYTAARNINTLARFLAKRDIAALTKQELLANYNIRKADLLILFGGCIAHGCDVAAKAVEAGIAERFMISGGHGHTTDWLRQSIGKAYPAIETMGKMEADMMSEYITKNYNIGNILMERRSTNCGNNIDYTIQLIKQAELAPQSIIIVQDSTMQMRMDAGFKNHSELTGIRIINYAAYDVQVVVKDGKLQIAPDLWGMWGIDRYISLLMGEIPRLMDDENGYGPNGKGFIAHVDIPSEVLTAFDYLKAEFGAQTRAANPEYASF